MNINRLESDLSLITNSKGWINWLEKMSKGLDKMKNSSHTIKRDFLNKNLREIGVVYDDDKKSHRLDILFKHPIVGDIFQYDVSGEKGETGFKKYNITDGTSNKVIEIPLLNYRKKQNEKLREKLNGIVIELRGEKGFSLQKVCDELNRLRLYSPTKKKWDKPKRSSYYKTIKVSTIKK